MFERSAKWVNRLEHFATIGSTNSYLEQIAIAQPDHWPDFSAVVADAQTSGRGRLDRDWLSPEGSSLAVSILLREATTPSWVSAMAALSLLAATSALNPKVKLGLKWPNDVIAGDRKLAGILVRAVSPAAIVVGVGVNLRPIPEFADSSTSLEQLGIMATPDEFLAHFLAGFRARYHRMRIEPDDFPTQARVEYLKHCVTVGRRVRVELPGGEELRGLATGIDDSGRLLVARESDFGEAAETTALAAGDVWHLRNL